MNENKLESTPLKAHLVTPQDAESRNVRRLQVEHMLLKGKTYREIETALTCSSKLIASVSKDIVQRNDDAAESTRAILQTRLLSTASKALQKLDDGLQTEDDLKTIQGIFNSTYDKAIGTKDNQVNVTVQLANMFSTSTASQDSKE
jgi:uncharacterized protein YerC